MKMQFPHVSSEGGPLILGDFQDLRHWNGGNFSDYQKACEVEEFSTKQIEIHGGSGLVWDLGGAGTAYLVKSETTSMMLVRFWSDSDLSAEQISQLVNLDFSGVAASALTVTSGVVSVLWAAEDARKLKMTEFKLDHHRGLAVGDGVCFVDLEPGNYKAEALRYSKGVIEVVALRVQQMNARADR